MLSEIFEQSAEFKNFLHLVREGKTAHSFLLSSKDAFSASQMAMLFARALLCPDLCGRCENCKKMLVNAHPDVKFYPQGGKLLVEDSKKIVDESFTKPIFADKKIFIIQNVDLSTDEAQNKLLKSLEEPQKNVFYILTTTNLDKVLPTIRSRCNKIEIMPCQEQDIEKLLSCSEEQKQLALKIGQGYVARTLELAKKKNLAGLFDLAVGLLKDLSSSKEAVVWSRKILDEKADFNLLIEILSMLVEDALFAKVDKNCNLRFEGKRKVVLQIAEALSIKCMANLQSVFDKTVRDLSYNVSPVLVADNLVMNILEVKYLCK